MLAIIAALYSLPTYANSTATMVKSEEGFRATPYLGKHGYIHIGYGYKLHKDKGLNPTDFLLVVNEDVASLMLEAELDKIKDSLGRGQNKAVFLKLSNARQDVIISMTYQLGYKGVMSFKKMWKALHKGEYYEAAIEALDSTWARTQTPERAMRHAKTLYTGKAYKYER